MSRGVDFLLAACATALAISICLEAAATEKDPKAPVYQTPNAVFDAYRQTGRDGDWESHYRLHTRDAQRDLVFESHFFCGMAGRDRRKAVEAVQRKSGCSELEFGKRFFEQYKRKHGHADVIDKFLAKAIPYWEAVDKATMNADDDEPVRVKPPKGDPGMDSLPDDKELARETLYEVTRDKVGFYAGVTAIASEGRNPSIIADLRDLVIDGDTATGRATITTVPGPGESPKNGRAFDRTYRFRRVNGGWLIDSVSN